MSLLTNPLFKAVRTHADLMLEFGRGCPSDPSIPLFGSVVDPLDRAVKTHQVMPPPGVRINDFSWAGNNLMHDVPFLETLIALGRLTGDARYEEAVDAIFAFYPKHCPHPETGLFPWGEHAQWSFTSRRIIPNACQDPFLFVEKGQVIHEHMRFAPAWFWERMGKADPGAVVKFARGLNLHIMNPETFEHNRHAPMDGRHWNVIPFTGKGKDFARHAGMYIFDCACAFRLSGDRSLLEWARGKMGYHLNRRLPDGIVPDCIRTNRANEEGQHDSLACSLFDAAQVLGGGTPEGRDFLEAARELFDARRNKEALGGAPRKENLADKAWNYGYGGSGPAWESPPTDPMVHARTGFQSYADRIIRTAEWQRAVQPPGRDWPIVTWAFVHNLQHPLEAYALTRDSRHLERALTVAGWALDRLAPRGLFMGVLNMDYFDNINIQFSIGPCNGMKSPRPAYYFSGTGAPSLVRNLLRLALLQEGAEDILGVDPHCR